MIITGRKLEVRETQNMITHHPFVVQIELYGNRMVSPPIVRAVFSDRMLALLKEMLTRSRRRLVTIVDDFIMWRPMPTYHVGTSIWDSVLPPELPSSVVPQRLTLEERIFGRLD